jgi:hypothetical protein
VYTLAYVSTASTALGGQELSEILAVSRENNEKVAITGALLYQDGKFLQILEGEEAPVRELYRRIAEDPRHHASTIVFQGAIQEREFPGWSMGFRDLSNHGFLDVPGSAQRYPEMPSRARRLLSVFLAPERSAK